MKAYVSAVAAAAVLAFSASPAHADLIGFTVKVGDPGEVNSSEDAEFDYLGVETFDGTDIDGNAIGTGLVSFTSNFGGSPITGTYSGVTVTGANQYGGAGNEGSYAVAGLGQTSSYSITFSQEGENGINYFGYWLSALDAGNTVEFFSGDTSLGTFTPANLLTFVSGIPDYYGNPYTGANSGEPYAFVNFYLNEGTFDKIVFRQAAGTAGYESDNHTVGWFTEQGGGTVIPGVPEPATWAMMILGFGVVGGAMRRRKQNLSVRFA